MAVFRVYQHKTKKNYQAVPVGFSVAAFFASFLWAAANNLWGKAFLLFLGFMVMIGAAAAGAWLNFPLLALSGLAGIALLPLWAGVQGQSWVCARLEAQNYQLVKRINSESATQAIQAAKRSHQAAEERDTPAGPKPAATFGRDFRDIRDRSAANANQPPPKDFNARPWRKG